MWAALAAILLSASTLVGFAQPEVADDDPLTPWPVEERCIPEPQPPAEDWTYPGMILMSGYAGIHGMQADWETPRVVAFFRADEVGDRPISGGQLSPDGQWYATPIGEIFAENFNNYWFVRGLIVYSTSGDGETFRISFDDFRNLFTEYGTAWQYLPIYWRDASSLFIGQLLIYPFENNAEYSPYSWDAYSLTLKSISPDLSRDYYRGEFRELSPTQDQGTVLATISRLRDISWRPDSSEFFAVVGNEEDELRLFQRYDRDGNFLETVLDLQENTIYLNWGYGRNNPVVFGARSISGRNERSWSDDGTQLAFIVSEPYVGDAGILHVLDWTSQVVVNTCLEGFESPVWSPDGQYFTYLAPGEDNLRLIVVDVENWRAYDVARHINQGRVEMVGWREAVE